MSELGNQAKAMVIMASRKTAVNYRQTFEKYINEHHYDDMGMLVAFFGKVNSDDDKKEYNDASMNGLPEDRTAKEFNKPGYRFLLVANKYQVGFDQPKLSAMYIMKKLRGVNAV